MPEKEGSIPSETQEFQVPEASEGQTPPPQESEKQWHARISDAKMKYLDVKTQEEALFQLDRVRDRLGPHNRQHQSDDENEQYKAEEYVLGNLVDELRKPGTPPGSYN